VAGRLGTDNRQPCVQEGGRTSPGRAEMSLVFGALAALPDSGPSEFMRPSIVWRVPTIADEVEVLARFGRALADPIRCQLLLILRDGPAHPAEMAAELEISRSRLSNHLACLRDCGLVVTVPIGWRIRYELADRRLGHALDDLRAAVVAVSDDACAVTTD